MCESVLMTQHFNNKLIYLLHRFIYPANVNERAHCTYLLIWDFQYDSYVLVSCRFGPLDYYWVPSSTWLAFLMVFCCALSLGSSLFSEVLRTSFLLRGLTHELSARLASTLWLGDVIQLPEHLPRLELTTTLQRTHSV